MRKQYHAEIEEERLMKESEDLIRDKNNLIKYPKELEERASSENNKGFDCAMKEFESELETSFLSIFKKKALQLKILEIARCAIKEK